MRAYEKSVISTDRLRSTPASEVVAWAEFSRSEANEADLRVGLLQMELRFWSRLQFWKRENVYRTVPFFPDWTKCHTESFDSKFTTKQSRHYPFIQFNDDDVVRAGHFARVIVSSLSSHKQPFYSSSSYMVRKSGQPPPRNLSQLISITPSAPFKTGKETADPFPRIPKALCNLLSVVAQRHIRRRRRPNLLEPSFVLLTNHDPSKKKKKQERRAVG